jgi:hypothetical protein
MCHTGFCTLYTRSTHKTGRVTTNLLLGVARALADAASQHSLLRLLLHYQFVHRLLFGLRRRRLGGLGTEAFDERIQLRDLLSAGRQLLVAPPPPKTTPFQPEITRGFNTQNE